MLRHDADRWIKAGVEYTDRLMHFSVVVTDQWSDWSLIPLADAPQDVDMGISLVRIGRTISIRYRQNEGEARLARITGFSCGEIVTPDRDDVLFSRAGRVRGAVPGFQGRAGGRDVVCGSQRLNSSPAVAQAAITRVAPASRNPFAPLPSM